MGVRGPAPKRSTARRRNNSPPADRMAIPGTVSAPPADDAWHEIARDWYAALSESGQAHFFEPSDWAAARLLADVMTRMLGAGKFSSVLFAAVWSAMGDLLTTEADRRRVRLEIERGAEPEKPAGVSALDEYRKRAGVG